MRLYFNRNTSAITRDPGTGATLSDSDSVKAKVGNNPPLQIAFHRDGPIETPNAPLIELISKTLKDYLGNALILCNAFTGPDANGFFVGYPDLTASVLHKALVKSTDVGADVANDAGRHAITDVENDHVVWQTDTKTLWIVTDKTKLNSDDGWSTDVPLNDSVQLGAEIVLRESPGFGKESSQSFILEIQADYDNDDETAPTPSIPFSMGSIGNRYDINALTGGATNDLDSIITASGNVRANALLALNVDGAALFWRLKASPAVTSSSIANPSVITTATPHGFPNGCTVTIGGHTGSTPDINGDHVITVLTSTTFSIPVNVTVAGAGGFATRATDTAAAIVRPVDFNAATNPVTWQSAL